MHNFTLPKIINVPHDNDGKNYNDHLFVDKITGTACIKLNIWKEGILREGQKRADFVCWFRNIQRAAWALCIPYRQENNELHAMFPDFFIVRRVEGEYIVDILEPHDPSRRDNIGKAKGIADYARQNSGIGKIQLIRETNKAGQNYFQRLDFSKGEIRRKIFYASTNNELDNIFEEYNKK